MRGLFRTHIIASMTNFYADIVHISGKHPRIHLISCKLIENQKQGHPPTRIVLNH